MDTGNLLYNRGFYLTDDPQREIPFYNSAFWKKLEIRNGLVACIHQYESFFSVSKETHTLFLLGHAYNPVKMISDENAILEQLFDSPSQRAFFDYVSELTGIFLLGLLDENALMLVGDPAGIQCVFYGVQNGRIHVASHTGMFEDVLHVRMTPYVSRLLHYKFYPLFGAQLPGDITPYEGFRRLIPNHYARIDSIDDTITLTRFFPTSEYQEYSGQEIAAAEQKIGRLLRNNLELIAGKWNNPAISLSGGCDSKTTLACTNGLYERFRFFSFISSETERIDAEAAHGICTSLGLRHTMYEIPSSNDAFEDFGEIKRILERNIGNIGVPNDNEIRKRIFFLDTEDFDVEVKSWVSECGRAYYNKRFAKSDFPERPNAHYMTTLYKVFFHDRRLIRATDGVFNTYLEIYMDDGLRGYPWQELFFWEFRMSAWNGLVITGEHKLSYDITIPYNNRLIIDMLLRMPLSYRISDRAYQDIRESMNPEVDKTGIAVTNVKHTDKRAKLERLYLDIMSRVK